MQRFSYQRGVSKASETYEKVKNALDTMPLPQIADDQVVQLGKFSCDALSKNPNKN